MATHELTTTIWKARCKVLHDGNSPDLRAIRDTEIAEITDLYTNQDLIGVGDRHYCARPMATILQKAPSTRRRWLRTMYRARERYARELQYQTRITAFFRRQDG